MKTINLPAPFLTFLAAIAAIFGYTPRRNTIVKDEVLPVETDALGVTSTTSALPDVIVPPQGVRHRKSVKFLTHAGVYLTAKVVGIEGNTLYISRLGGRPFPRELA